MSDDDQKVISIDFAALNYTWAHHFYDFLAYVIFLSNNTQKLNTSMSNRHEDFYTIDHKETHRYFLMKLQNPTYKYIKKDNLAHTFSNECSKIFKNTILVEQLRVTACHCLMENFISLCCFCKFNELSILP